MPARRIPDPRPSTRSDARRSRAALIAAARACFDELGVGAPMDQIAKRAGLANATLYRHFSDREALIEAAYRQEVDVIVGGLERAGEIDDAWLAFETMLEMFCELQARNRGFGELISMRFPNIKPLFGERGRQVAITREIVRRAQREGTLRGDFVLTDIVALLWANSRIVEATKVSAPDAWRRYLGFALDAFRGDGERSRVPRAMTARQTTESMIALAGRSAG